MIYPNFVYDPYNPNSELPESIEPNEHTPEYEVRRNVTEYDALCIKTIYEDGFGGTEEMTWELPTKEIIGEIVQSADQEGIPVLLHANSYAAQLFGLETGVDIIAHGLWHWGPIEEFLRVSELPDSHKKLLRDLASKKVGYQPTFRVIEGQRDVFDSSFVTDPNLEHVLPKEMVEWLRSDEGLWQKRRILTYVGDFFDEGTPDQEIADIMQFMVDKISVSFKMLYDNEGNALFGSDTPAMNNHTNPPGYNGYLEMRAWYEAGISLEDILRAATINNAHEFKLDDEIGSIQVGKKANLLLMDSSPLETIEAYNRIAQVIIGGKLIERSDLSAKSN